MKTRWNRKTWKLSTFNKSARAVYMYVLLAPHPDSLWLDNLSIRGYGGGTPGEATQLDDVFYFV